jgi:chemotaxis protein histidine kinase CheA
MDHTIEPEELDIFKEEIMEMKEGLEQVLTHRDTIEPDCMYNAYRMVHRIKGDSQFLALDACTQLTAKMVAPLHQANEQRNLLSKDEVSELQEGLELILKRQSYLASPLTRTEQEYLR